MTSPDIETQYRNARTLHTQQRLGEARKAYLEVLRLAPDHAGALHALGNLDLRAGKLADSERLIRRAIELAPTAAGFQNSLGNVLRASGRHEAAAQAYHAELSQRPDFAASHHQLALMRMQQGNLARALEHAQKAIFYAPKFVAAYNTMGRIYNNLGNLDAASQAFRRALVFDPDYADAHFNLGHVQRRQGDLAGAVGSFRTAAERDSRHQRAQRELGITLLSMRQPLEAIAHFERALELDANDSAAHFGMGLIFQDRGMIEAATRHFERAVALTPDNPDAQCNLGATLRSQGQFDAAITRFRKALALQPAHVAALSGLCSVLEMQGDYHQAFELLQPFAMADAPPELVAIRATLLERLDRRDDGIALLEQALNRPGMTDLDRTVLQFKLGDLLDHAARYDEAWATFEKGNGLRQTDYDPERREAVVDSLLAAWSAPALKALPRSGCQSDRPIFIVGMPRSGTSLVEQILASHPQVFGAGELNTIGLMALGLGTRLGVATPYPGCVSALTEQALTTLASEYLARIGTLNGEALRVTDKMWQNYENLGLIEAMFPQARIVHCLRDPRDSLLSCYFQLFGAGGVPFSYDPAHLVSAWSQYCRLMRHWRKVLSIPMLEVRYEQLVNDPEPGIRRLLEFAGLDWDPRCLEFHKTRRAVTTASYHQVKQPMYRGSAGRYRNYLSVMDPQLLALEPLES